MTTQEALLLLKNNPDLKPIVKEALDHFLNFTPAAWPFDTYCGFEDWELPSQPPTQALTILARGGILKVVRKTSRGRTSYSIDPEKVEGLQLSLAEEAQLLETPQPPGDLFRSVVGYPEAKELLVRGVTAARPVHFLLIGPPASAKTVFLLEIHRIPGAEYHIGSSTSRAGLASQLLANHPKFLLIDEIDKMAAIDQNVLLSLCETGLVKETKYGRFREAQLETKVFAAGNLLTTLRPEIISRFQVLHFSPYTKAQFIEVVERILEDREGLPLALGRLIGGELWKLNPDPREAIRLARLLTEPTEEAVKELFKLVNLYRKP